MPRPAPVGLRVLARSTQLRNVSTYLPWRTVLRIPAVGAPHQSWNHHRSFSSTFFLANSSTNSNGSSSSSVPTSNPSASAEPNAAVEPRMAIAFTCVADGCGERSVHHFTKRSYERGIVIIKCPNCDNRHLIADHLGWFKESTEEGKLKTIEDLMRAKGEKVVRGSLDANGVVEYSE